MPHAAPFHYDALWQRLADQQLLGWLDKLRPATAEALDPARNGHWPRWQNGWQRLPTLLPNHLQLDQSAVTFGLRDDLDTPQAEALPEALRAFHPWRKGPWQFFGTTIDTEWRSDWKWQRLAPHLKPLAGRRVLDIGCGNGYYGWRALGAGAREVLGLDPFLPYTLQFQVGKRYHPDAPIDVLPLGVEQLQPRLQHYDTVLSMGVIYHRKDPLTHLLELCEAARPGGEIVVESIVIDGPTGHLLRPRGRYAKMRNVHALPTPGTLEAWMRQAGLRDVRTVHCGPTTTDEQRTTEWMTFESLPDFLDPADPARTIEGHPAPLRAITLGTCQGS